MNSKILLITVFISNIAFGAVISIPNTLKITNTKEKKYLACKSAQKLYERGLERKVAINKIQKSLQNSFAINEIMAQNILRELNIVKENDLVSFIAQEALKNKTVNLSSYEILISLVQHNSRLLLDKRLLTKIERLSSLNKQVKKMGLNV